MPSATGYIIVQPTTLVRAGLALQETEVRDQVDIQTTYHFRVTWPFWTRFILKPTVGMELWPSISAWTTMTMLEVARSSGYGHVRNSVAAGLRYTGQRWTYSTVNSPPWTQSVTGLIRKKHPDGA